MSSIVAENVKKRIKEMGIIQKIVAERAGYDPKVFSNMLCGRKIITDQDIPPIAKALGVSPNYLFGFLGETARTS